MLFKEPQTTGIDHEGEEEIDQDGHIQRPTMETICDDIKEVAKDNTGPHHGLKCPEAPKKEETLFDPATPRVIGAYPLTQPTTTPAMAPSSSTTAGQKPAAVQNSTGNRLSGKIPKVEPKLSGQENYTEWLHMVEMTLFLYDLTYAEESYWDIVTGMSTLPSEKVNEREWKKANYFSLLLMFQNCEEEALSKITLCKSANEAYKALQSAYEATDLGTVVASVIKMTFDDRTRTIEEHITEYDKKWAFMRFTVTRMKANQTTTTPQGVKGFQDGIALLAGSGKAKGEFLMMTLPPFYASLIENLRMKEDFTYGDITRSLIQYVPGRQNASRGTTANKKTNGCNKGSSPGNPIVLRTEPGKDRVGKPIDTSKRCGYCQKVKKWKGIGHTESECKTKQRERGGQRARHIEPYIEDEFGKSVNGMLLPHT